MNGPLHESFSRHRRGLFRASVLLIALSAVGKCAGFARESLLAYYLGATAKTDVYLLAYMFFDWATFTGGAVLLAAIPDLDRAGLSLKPLYKRFRNAMLVVFLPVVLMADMGAMVMARTLPAAVRNEFLLFAAILNWAFPLMGWVSLQAAVLQSRKLFGLPGILATAMNLVAIAALVAWHRNLGALSMVIGLLSGLILQVAAQGVRIWRVRPEPVLNPSPAPPRTSAFLRRIWAIASSQLIVKCMLLVDRVLAVHLGAGMLSYLGYASRLVLFPLTLAGTAISNALFPFQVEALREDQDRYHALTAGALRAMFLVGTLVCAMLVALASPLVQLSYQRGHFSPADSARTTAALLAYAGMTVPSFLNIVLNNILYCKVRARVYLPFSAMLLLAYSTLAWGLIPWAGYTAMGWATTISAALQAASLLVYLQSRDHLRLAPGTGSFALRGAVTGVVAWAAAKVCSSFLVCGDADGFLHRSLTGLLLPSCAAVLAFCLFGHFAAGLHELAPLIRMLHSRRGVDISLKQETVNSGHL